MPANEPRLTNPMAPLSRLLNSTLTVADIVSTPLWSVPASMKVKDAHDAMAQRRFDVGGVTPDPPQRYVHQNDLKEAVTRGSEDDPVENHARSIPASECIEKTLPVATLLQLFEEHERLFVLDGNAIRWVITHADLVAPAVSVSVLAYLILIESGLKQLASRITDEDIESLLSSKRVKEIRKRNENRENNNVDTGLRDILYLSDWLTVIEKTDLIRESLGYKTKNAFSRDTGAFNKVRNDLAHGRDLLVESEKPVAEVLNRIRRIREFCELVWRQVDFSLPTWDDFAKTVFFTQDQTPVILTGVNAAEDWRYSSPAFVLSASNPGGVWVSEERNRDANRRLRERLERQEATVIALVSSFFDGTSEKSFLIQGLRATQVAELAILFGQRAYFEVDAQNLKVHDSTTMNLVRSAPRRGS